MSNLSPAFRQQFLDSNGDPLAGGKLYTYAAGTTTPLATYTDSTGLTPNANPIILDSSGAGNIWLGTSNYKFVLEDSLSNVIQTVDNISAGLARDANANFSANSFLEGYTTTPTAAGTTTLTVASSEQQYFTGSTTQTVKLPVTSTLILGQKFLITNLSSGIVTVQSSGSNTLQAMAANSQLIATCISISGTGTASWSWVYTSYISNISANSILGNNTGGALPPIQLTGTQATAMLNAMVGDSGSGGTKGLAPAPSSGDAAAGKFLKADGTFAVPQADISGNPLWTGYQTNASGWTYGTNVSPTDPTGVNTSIITAVINVGPFTVIQPDDGSGNFFPGVKFTPPATGNYQVRASFVGYEPTGTNNDSLFVLVDGAGNRYDFALTWRTTASGGVESLILSGIINIPSVTATTIKIQMAGQTTSIPGTLALPGDVNWQIVKVG